MIDLVAKENIRIDKYIADNTHLSRADVKELIKQKAISVDDLIVNNGKFIVKLGANIHISKVLDKQIHVEAQKMDLDVLFEDDYLMIINKPSGLVVHPAPGHSKNTLVNGLLYFAKQLSNENGLLRPGIVHRLDKDTSGLMIVAKTNEAHRLLSTMLSEHLVKRQYLAIVKGWINHQISKINAPIGRSNNDRKKMSVTNINSKEAKTTVKLLKRFKYDNKMFSLVECTLETGRTHQIRVHLNYIEHPVFNDPVYSNAEFNPEFGQYLHAYKLTFTHPFTNKVLEFETKTPQEFQDLIDKADEVENN
ncbi:23S rRNA pseudouridine1911/1915/1917 synthase [Mycoplasma testudineum]|uniref:Pseudouridine synthase n=1 Tax=Mycoplasma testudineum TaxID=244584 RepID=A0A4R6IJN6_9MOLU|nr:RluA family pseudouridine synthase [Mycoplasma testudineum]OYD26454.1 RluA family pseudouridine synthase [Mycoplasma testudineum]TDO22156.1 23S rRNA pseudouridine1911/1915/1917 synthase [Mycoplasma testudineum]